MQRLLYISTARKPIPTAELRQLLNVSRRNNRMCGVTGLLLVGGNRFLQVLEGERAGVQDTYERIKHDPRHFAAVVLSDRPAAEPLFADWSMGLRRSTFEPDHMSIQRNIAALISPIADPTIRAYFEGFALQHAA